MYKDRDGTKYTVVLSKTDVVAKKNSYYKLQILKDNSKDKLVHLQIEKYTDIKKHILLNSATINSHSHTKFTSTYSIKVLNISIFYQN